MGNGRRVAGALASTGSTAETGSLESTLKFRGHELRVSVVQPDRRSCDVRVYVPTCGLDADTTYQLLVHPENHHIFKNQRKAQSRVVEYDNRVEQRVNIVQAAQWRFLMFSGTFFVNLIVVQNKRTRTVAFRLAKPGFMNRFEGLWEIKPRPKGDKLGKSEIILKQSLELCVSPPPGMGYLVRRVSAHVTSQVFKEFFTETENIVAGRPTLTEFVDVSERPAWKQWQVQVPSLPIRQLPGKKMYENAVRQFRDRARWFAHPKPP
ncbi:hypothetical protein FVE85_8136 [Porphyridium purpureum]|uniref:Coenzyme Q-binding protein COQ10 START domain-containing protein n=1 Tax=Porphyridium purpureum TaxID=35688 RepID=A0A5J4YMG5_PORPP|nr:hypothetical protein FVE85_8136 [Porphyridium purpureum]|eukprot:POR3845..scf295_9